MKVTSKEIREKLAAVWPGMEYVWLWDKTYWMPKLETVQYALGNSNVPGMDFVDEFHDCDDFAVQFMAETRRKRYFQWKEGKLPDESRYPIALAFVFGDMFRGIGKVHAANLCLCREGLYMVDATPGENRLWEAKADQDNLIFLFM